MSPAAAERDPSGNRPADHAAAASATEVADARLERHVADLSTRLRPICRDWDAAAFEAMVLRIARTKVRWADIESRS
jgi:hypothetical protein